MEQPGLGLVSTENSIITGDCISHCAVTATKLLVGHSVDLSQINKNDAYPLTNQSLQIISSWMPREHILLVVSTESGEQMSHCICAIYFHIHLLCAKKA